MESVATINKNITNRNQATKDLLYIVKNSSKDMLKLLIDLGADVTIED